ncbi:MAG: CAP domain-containing protein [Marinibacterium sp.]
MAVVILTICAGTGVAGPAGDGLSARVSPQALERINAERTRRALPPLTYDDRLAQAALAHSRDMAAGRFMAHRGRDGTSVGDRVTRAGLKWCFVAENVARGYTDAAGVTAGWMNSPGHRDNILSRATLGAVARAGPDGAKFWTAVFANPC